MNKILIIDSGMKNIGGHNFSYTRATQTALAERGYGTDVLTNNKLSDDLAKEFNYHPTFSHGAYDFPPAKGIRQVIEHIYAQSVIYSNELEEFFEKNSSDYAAIFCHTVVADFELIGWNRFLSRNKLNSHLFLLLRNTQSFSRMSFAKRNFHPYLRIKPYYLNAIYSKLKDRFTLLTDSQPLTNDYATVFKHRIVTMPIPLNKYFLDRGYINNGSFEKFKNRFGLNEKKGIRVGYMGDARSLKGFFLLPELVRDVIEKTKDIQFVIQCPRSASGSDTASLPRGVAELNEIAARAKDRVVLVSERLTEEDYANLFYCLDVVLIPYSSPVYREATSGIFAEAVALGKPVVVTEDSWMAYELKKFGGGLEFKRDDSRDLSAKLYETIENYETLSAKAQSYSGKWCEFHNAHSLAGILIREIEK